MRKKIIFFSLVLFLLVSVIILYARYGATSGILVKEYSVYNSNVPSNFHGIKVVHLSDIHFGRTVNLKKFGEIKDKVNRLNPDIVVITGDLLDKDYILNEDEKSELINILKSINSKLGKYGIAGNHDFKHEYFNTLLSNSGFKNLNNNFELIYNESLKPIIIAGLNSNLKDDTLIAKKLEGMTKYLEENRDMQDAYKILIMHEPDFIDNMNYASFNLILAGHTHGGQVRLPLIGAFLLPAGGEKYYDEYYKLTNTDLYVSSGLGTSNMNFRFLNKPSFNFYRILKK